MNILRDYPFIHEEIRADIITKQKNIRILENINNQYM